MRVAAQPSPGIMTSKDPYLDFLNTDDLLFGSKSNGASDPLKFNDPLSFGTSDALSSGTGDILSRSIANYKKNLPVAAAKPVADPLKFSDPGDALSRSIDNYKKTADKEKKDKDDLGDFDADSTHSDDEASAPPMDYLGYIQVTALVIYLISLYLLSCSLLIPGKKQFVSNEPEFYFPKKFVCKVVEF